MAEFQSTMTTVLNWLLIMLSDLVGLFLQYPFMGFIMMAGIIYLCIDSVLLIFSGHGGANIGKASLKRSAANRFRSGQVGSVSSGFVSSASSGSGSFRFSSGSGGSVYSGYNSSVGGKAFLKDQKISKGSKRRGRSFVFKRNVDKSTTNN